MADKAEGNNDALGRIAPRRRSSGDPTNPYAPRNPVPRDVPPPISAPRQRPVATRQPPRPSNVPVPRPQKVTKPEVKQPEIAVPTPIVKPVETTVKDQEDELDEIIRDVKSGKPKKLLGALYIVCVVVIICALAVTAYYFVLYKKPSAYSKLTTENYNENSISFSFKYPAILNKTTELTAKNPNVLVAFDKTIGPDNTLVDMSTLSDSQVLQPLKLSPSDVLNQIRNGKGSYVDLLNKNYPNNYKQLFGTCGHNMVNS